MKKSTKWDIAAFVLGLLAAICFFIILLYGHSIFIILMLSLFVGTLVCLDKAIQNYEYPTFNLPIKEPKKEKSLVEELEEHFDAVLPPTQEERKVFDNYMAERKGDINTYPPIVSQRNKAEQNAKLIAAGEAVGVLKHKPFEKDKENIYREKLKEAQEKMNKVCLAGNNDAYQEYHQTVIKCEKELMGALEEMVASNEEEVQMMNERASAKKKSKKKHKTAPKKKKLPAQKKKTPKKGKR